jgi:hypothetical protein
MSRIRNLAQRRCQQVPLPPQPAESDRSSKPPVRAPAALKAIVPFLALCIPVAGTFADEPATSPSSPKTQPTTAASARPFPAMRQWFADLGSADGEVRDQAMVNLMGLRADDLPALRKLVEESRPLAPQQLVALKQIVIHDYLAGEPYDAKEGNGFLGIHLPGPTEEAEAVVVNRLPGFVGERMLRDGDVILGVVERPEKQIHSGNELTLTLGQFSAGQTIHLQILRQGHVIRVLVQLDPYPLDASPELRDRMDDFLFRRLKRAQDYWDEHFADLVEETVS